MNRPAEGRGKDPNKGRQILQAASKLFVEHGFAAVSMDQIASAAGVSKQTVYSHFGSKEDLFAAAIEAKCVEFHLSNALYPVTRPVKQALLEFAHDLSELLRSDDVIKLSRVLMSPGTEPNDIANIAWQVSSKRTIEELARYLELQNERGTLSVTNPDLAARQFLAMIDGFWHKKQLMGIATSDDFAMIDDYNKLCVDLFCKGYAVTS
jgi:TetR/AcrR family transcriptional repressor of mexJK operon